MGFDGNWMGWWEHADIVVRSVFIILVAASLVTWAVFFLKLAQFSAWAKAENRAAKLLVTDGRAGLNQLSADAPTRQLAEAATRMLQRRKATAAELQERLDAVQGLIRVEQERLLTILASVGSASPFIGLLGTVWGIMHAPSVRPWSPLPSGCSPPSRR